MFFTLASPLLGAVDVLDRLDRRWQARFGRVRRGPARPDCSCTSARVDHVVDPDGSMRLVRVAGVVTVAMMPHLVRSWDDLLAPGLLHIDLTDAIISDLTTMLALERAVDHLERRGVDIRIVGLDPAHPALMA